MTYLVYDLMLGNTDYFNMVWQFVINCVILQAKN
jgi:hypothetical protein